MHHSGVEALVQRDLIASALMFGAVMSGLLSALFVGVWARAQFGGGTALWWQVEAPHSHPHTNPHTHTHTPTPTPIWHCSWHCSLAPTPPAHSRFPSLP